MGIEFTAVGLNSGNQSIFQDVAPLQQFLARSCATKRGGDGYWWGGYDESSSRRCCFGCVDWRGR